MSAEVIPFHIWMECLEVDAEEDVACDREKSQLLQWLIKESITDVPLLRLIEECDLDKLCGCLSVLKELLNKLGAKATGNSLTVIGPSYWLSIVLCGYICYHSAASATVATTIILLLCLYYYHHYYCCY